MRKGFIIIELTYLRFPRDKISSLNERQNHSRVRINWKRSSIQFQNNYFINLVECFLIKYNYTVLRILLRFLFNTFEETFGFDFQKLHFNINYSWKLKGAKYSICFILYVWKDTLLRIKLMSYVFFTPISFSMFPPQILKISAIFPFRSSRSLITFSC